MRSKKYLFTVMMVCFYYLTEAQTIEVKDKNNGVFNITQFGYGFGKGTIGFKKKQGIRNNGRIFRLRTTFGYFIKPEFSLGVGFGLDGYHLPNYNTAPLVLDLKYYFKPQKRTVFISGNAGYSFKFSQPFTEGQFYSINAGYRYIFNGKTHLLVSGGLDIHQMKTSYWYLVSPTGFEMIEKDFWLKSLSINVGFLF